ncbi:MAG: hypothetical protein K0A99_01950 [Desulfoarculaceae bacterium]|nr:hypothetical protein [Desulfoarculaceae bacterium]
MTILSEQLATILQEIKDNFTHHQQIQVTPVAGDPPEQYRVIYHLRGLCREKGGEVHECSDHIITITLPFGFPHFPPSCKPESPVFHPDFDQAAIYIGEFWENNHSLPELIIHIGRMLGGESYSRNNAFNEKAAIWYQENQQRLPLDTVQQLSVGADSLSFPDAQTAPSPEPLTMAVDDFLPDTETAARDEPEADRPAKKIPADEMVKKTFSLHPAQYPEPDIDQEDSESQHQLVKARQLHQEGEAFEQLGQPAKAWARYKAARELAHDFPEIEKDISRAQYSLEMLGDWAGESSPEKETGTVSGKRAAPVKERVSGPGPQKKQTSRWPAMVIGGAALLLIVTVSSLYINGQLQQAQTMLAECQQFLDREQLTDAEQKCTEALKLTARVLFIKQQEKKLLTEHILQLQNSRKSKEVLALSAEDKGPPKWQQSRNLADTQLAAGRWQEALGNYTLALQLASEIRINERAVLESLRNRIRTTRINISVEAGEQSLAASAWDSAQNHFDRAMAIASQNPLAPETLISRLKSFSGQVDFNRLMASAEQYFSRRDWQKALTAYEKAEAREKEFPFADSRTLASLREAISRSKVFNALEQGKKDFANGQWDQAIEQYDLALQVLEENSETLGRDNPMESQQEISKLMLHATIIRDQQSTANSLKNKEFSQAIDTLQMTIETISMSSFAGEEEFQTIIKETRVSIHQAREDLLMAGHISYLTSNYQKLFIDNNPALIAENLSHPRVTFLKKIGKTRLYQIQCSEQGHNRPVVLQTHYLFDPATRKWHFFQEG